MTGQENFQANDGASQNNNVLDSGAKCLFADAYSGIKCGGKPATNDNESGAVRQRMNETANNDRTQSATGTQPIDNNSDLRRTQSGGTGFEKPNWPNKLSPNDNSDKEGKQQIEKMPYEDKFTGKPSMGQNDKFSSGKPLQGEVEKFPNGKIPEGHLDKFPKDKLPNGLENKMPGKLPYGEKDKVPNKMEGQLDNFNTKTGKDGQLRDKLNKGEGGGGGFKDGKGYGGGGGYKDGSQGGGGFGKELEKHGSGSLGPVDKNADGTIDGGEKQFDKNGNNVLDEHEQMHGLANEAKRAAKAGSEAAGEAAKGMSKGAESLKKEIEGLNKQMEEFDKGGCPEFEDERESNQMHQVHPSEARGSNDHRGAMGTLPSIREIAPDINNWSRLERGGSAGRGGYNETPAEQRQMRRQQYRNY